MKGKWIVLTISAPNNDDMIVDKVLEGLVRNLP